MHKFANRYGWDYNKIIDMPEALVNMYLREMYLDDVADRMVEILKTGGEDALKKLPESDPSRQMYIRGRLKAREQELKEHEEVKKMFKKELN